ncbi:MAG: T9SS type A sorting domain-containing protein [Bacteroidetes bacterium]|nr:T9SS type A sorting domain-containing protein [Bacteroidota bacterium]
MKKGIIILVFLAAALSRSESQTWVQTLNGISMWAVCADVQGNVYAGTSGTVKAIYKTTNGGQNWLTLLSNGASNFLSLSVDSLGNIFAANSANGVMKSTDGGNNWTNIPASVFNGKTCQSVCCGRNGIVIVGTVSGGTFRSTDYGVTFPDTSITSSSIVLVSKDRYNANIFYAGASSTSGVTGFFISTNAGASFTGPYATYNCWGIVQKSTTELYYATTSTGYPFSKSTDGGYTWISVGVQPAAMRGAALDLAGNIYISGNNGVFKSTNNGQTFNNAGMTSSANLCVCVGNKIYVAATGTTTGGVWIGTDTTISSINPVNTGIPGMFSLEQNFPNPFNPETRINFNLAKNGNVTISIYDAAGKLIEKLIDEFKPAGTYSLAFNGSGLCSGIYYCKMQAGDFNETRKMALVK